MATTTSLSTFMMHALEMLRRSRQPGQGLVEYALILVLISIVAITIMTTVGGNINTIFQTASNALVTP